MPCECGIWRGSRVGPVHHACPASRRAEESGKRTSGAARGVGPTSHLDAMPCRLLVSTANTTSSCAFCGLGLQCMVPSVTHQIHRQH